MEGWQREQGERIARDGTISQLVRQSSCNFVSYTFLAPLPFAHPAGIIQHESAYLIAISALHQQTVVPLDPSFSLSAWRKRWRHTSIWQLFLLLSLHR